MKIASCAISVLLLTTLISAQQTGQRAKESSTEKKQAAFASNRCFSKGGIGIVNASLYIVVKSAKNKLLLGKNEAWCGLDASKPEIAVFFEEKVWASQSLPAGFDLSKAVVVSFEGDKIRFFDYQAMSGGYYERIRE